MAYCFEVPPTSVHLYIHLYKWLMYPLEFLWSKCKKLWWNFWDGQLCLCHLTIYSDYKSNKLYIFQLLDVWIPLICIPHKLNPTQVDLNSTQSHIESHTSWFVFHYFVICPLRGTLMIRLHLKRILVVFATRPYLWGPA